jgi:signal transduction histidine kinase
LQITHKEKINLTQSIHNFILKANKTLLEILVTNLIHNAIRHTPAKGTIEITVKPGVFTVSNTSENGELSESNLFKRFEKGSKDENSTGLGLAIVKRICEVSGYTISYSYEKERHIFTVHFSSL